MRKQTRIIPVMAQCSTYPRQNSERHQLVSVLLGAGYGTILKVQAQFQPRSSRNLKIF